LDELSSSNPRILDGALENLFELSRFRHTDLFFSLAAMQPMRAPSPSREVLIVHADPDSRLEIRRCLNERSLGCREAATAQEALALVQQAPPDLIILDLYLPDQSGLGLCRTIRESPELERVPIIAVASQASEMDRVLAFESGVDDFLPRPFYPPELGARALAVLRGFSEIRRVTSTRSLPQKAVSVDARARRAFIDGRPLDLTSREFALLSALVGEAGRVLTRHRLIEQIWGHHLPSSERTIDAHIKSIRRKLGESRHCIETVRGVGYRFSDRG
jgi:DNA-binding response OmpR family regulator